MLLLLYKSNTESAKQPMFVLDGKEINPPKKSDLNPNDIEAIHILKDKEAIKKYGKRGENGVLIITTKIHER